MWLTAAVLSALFAGLTSVLAKCGIKKTDSDVATALRTVIVLLFSWLMAFIAGSAGAIRHIDVKSLIFLILSGLATGASWLCYFKALSMGDVNKVVPIDKSSTILTVLLAMVIFQETEHLGTKLAGTALLAAGIFLMLERRKAKDMEAAKAAIWDREAQREIDQSKSVQSDPIQTNPAQGRSVQSELVQTKPAQTKSAQGGELPGGTEGGSWALYAVLSAIFAALTSILAKVGITDVESNLGTAVRTGVVLIMAWIIVFVKGKQRSIQRIDKRELLFIGFSGLATGASWLCYYYAIQNGVVSVVVPIDKLSIIVTVICSRFLFGERLTPRGLAGLALMVAGTLVMAVGT